MSKLVHFSPGLRVSYGRPVGATISRYKKGPRVFKSQPLHALTYTTDSLSDENLPCFSEALKYSLGGKQKRSYFQSVTRLGLFSTRDMSHLHFVWRPEIELTDCVGFFRRFPGNTKVKFIELQGVGIGNDELKLIIDRLDKRYAPSLERLDLRNNKLCLKEGEISEGLKEKISNCLAIASFQTLYVSGNENEEAYIKKTWGDQKIDWSTPYSCK